MYNIIFKSGEIEEVDNEIAVKILQAFSSGKEKILLNNKLRDFRGILDIKPAQEDKYEKLPEVKTTWTRNKKLNALKSMRAGFLRGISNSNNPTNFQKQFIKNIDERTTKTEKSSRETFTAINSVKDVGFEMP